MRQTPLMVTIAADQLREVAGLDIQPVHMAYRVAQGGHLSRTGGSNVLRRGLMGVECQGFSGGGNPSSFCQEVLRECSARGLRGVVCQFSGSRLGVLEKIITQLGNLFDQRGWELYVPEKYAHCHGNTKILVSSALSGGSLRSYFEEKIARYGGHRVILELEPVAEDFFLPSPQGSGLLLTPSQLEQKITDLNPSIFFSPELCARYFTYMSAESGVHFVLFDDGDTVRSKILLGEELGLAGVLGDWKKLKRWRDTLGLERQET